MEFKLHSQFEPADLGGFLKGNMPVFIILAMIFVFISSCENSMQYSNRDNACTINSSELFITVSPDPYVDYRSASRYVSEYKETEIFSENSLEGSIPSIFRCGNYLCALAQLENYDFRLFVYDTETFDVIWKSSCFERENTIRVVKNSSFAYIINSDFSGYIKWIKIIKFAENGIFEEADFKMGDSLKIHNYYGVQTLSENNILMAKGRKNDSEVGIIFFDMNNYEKTDENYIFFPDLNIENAVADNNIFWGTSCEVESYESPKRFYHYICYAEQFDLSDPKNPKIGKKINIPGEIIAGTSNDGKYLYTKTKILPHMPQGGGTLQEFYALKLNSDKTDRCSLKQESLSGYRSDLAKEDFPNARFLSYNVYIKDDKAFFISKLLTYDMDDYPESRQTTFGVRLLSLKKGEIFNKSFENARFVSNVEGGGFVVFDDKSWTYISTDGVETIGGFDESSDAVGQELNSVLINSRIYVPIKGYGIYSSTVQEQDF